MSENFESMTVLELRSAAKRLGVKLGAGISKQGIIDKLNAACQKDEPKPAEKPVQQSAPVRTASIIADDDFDDDVPVLTPNYSRPAPQPAKQPAPATAAPKPSSLSSISSKAPAFTMEGTRAWHNPRAFTPTPYPQSAPQAAPSAAPAAQGAHPWQSRPAPQPAPAVQRPAPAPRPVTQPAPQTPRTNDYSGFQSQPAPVTKTALADLLAAGDCGDGAGILEIHPDGFGFLRGKNYLPGASDVYVSNAQIRRFSLRTGDYIEGKTRPQREGDRYSALLYITKVDDVPVDDLGDRPSFDDLTAIYPKKRITLAPKTGGEPFLRQLDLLSPVGFGQRLSVGIPMTANKSAFLTTLTDAIVSKHPSAKLTLLVVDEKPEEVTALRERVKAEVLAADIDDPPESQVKVAEMVLENAERLVELKRDVIVIVDSLTRLARAYNMVAPSNARMLPCGMVVSALTRLKHFFGAARMTKEGGSLTLIALSDIGLDSAIADFVLDEFRTSRNAVWTLNPDNSLHLTGCQTQRDNLQLTPKEQALAASVRAVLGRDPDHGEKMINDAFADAQNQDELEEKLASMQTQAE